MSKLLLLVETYHSHYAYETWYNTDVYPATPHIARENLMQTPRELKNILSNDLHSFMETPSKHWLAHSVLFIVQLIYLSPLTQPTQPL